MRKHLSLLMLSFFAMVATEATAKTKTESVTVTSVGYATFSSDKDLDFTSAVRIKAYTAKISGSSVNFSRIKQVPAGTGVLLWASRKRAARQRCLTTAITASHWPHHSTSLMKTYQESDSYLSHKSKREGVNLCG